MGTEARSPLPWGLTSRVALACAVLLVLGAFLPAIAAADYRNPRLSGLESWQPDFLRIDNSLVTLLGRRETGRLQGTKKVREDVNVDLSRHLLVANRRYGEIRVAPEFVQDLHTATLAAARAAA